MNYGVRHAYYAHTIDPLNLATWSSQFPRGFRGLGAVDPNCAASMPYDVNGNPCTNCAAGMPYDESGNPCPAATPASPTPGPGGAPTGSILLYQGVWQVTTTLNVNTILSRVSQALQSSGVLQVMSQTNTGSVLTIGNFNVALTLQVTGAGFNRASDAGSIVDHAYYTVTGMMPVNSSTVLQSTPGAVIPPPAAGAPPPAGTGSSWLSNIFGGGAPAPAGGAGSQIGSQLASGMQQMMIPLMVLLAIVLAER